MKICTVGDCGGHLSGIFHGKLLHDRPFGGLGKLEYPGASVSSRHESAGNIIKYGAGRGHDIPFYSDWREMLDTVKPDAVAVDTIFSNHAGVILYAFERGIHVYTEKPAAITSRDLDKIESTLKSSKSKLFAMLTARFDPWFFTAKKFIEGGAVGDVLMVNGQKSYKLGHRPDFFKSRDTYGSTISWVGIHAIDQVLWLTGLRCHEVYAKKSTYGNRDHGDLEMSTITLMVLENDVIANVTADYARPQNAVTHGDDRIRITGTEGVLEVRDEKVWLINKHNEGIVPIETINPEPVFDGFLRVISGSSDPVYRDCDGLNAARICIAASNCGSVPVKL